LASVAAVRCFFDRCDAILLAGMDRTVPFFMNEIKPDSIDKGKSVLIASSE
jgi:bisphosphoglycerate-dependent phosphoglycerate mutase